MRRSWLPALAAVVGCGDNLPQRIDHIDSADVSILYPLPETA